MSDERYQLHDEVTALDRIFRQYSLLNGSTMTESQSLIFTDQLLTRAPRMFALASHQFHMYSGTPSIIYRQAPEYKKLMDLFDNDLVRESLVTYCLRT